MPDWSYQTVFRPVLFGMPPASGRNLALGGMGLLSRLPLGTTVIDFLGHMRPDPGLRHTVRNLAFPNRIGLGACIDPQLVAVGALSQFGVGFLEVGPFTLEPTHGGGIQRDCAAESLTIQVPRENPGLEAALRRLSGATQIPLFVRLAVSATADGRELETILDRLGPCATGFIVELDRVELDQTASPAAGQPLPPLVQQLRRMGDRVVLLSVSRTSAVPAPDVLSLVEAGTLDGVVVEGQAGSGCWQFGRADFEETRRAVRVWRDALPTGATILAGGGVHEPLQALELIDAGSDFVRVESGLVYSGPGLIKRINEALLFRRPHRATTPVPPEKLSWFWTGLIGTGMFAGGLLALIIAATRVLMPYDEAASGLSRADILGINDRLLHFMAHDRVTLAGTMLAVGILYVALSFWGSRRGMHWARRTIIVSSSAGFVSFFLFLGFGYFDPFHAFVTAVLFQLLIMAVHCGLPAPQQFIAPELTNDRAWRLSQWGQLAFIVHGAILIVAGCVISLVGITTVFVPEDLEFMHTTSAHLHAAHPQLVPLIAHDRATFGGMLIACGVCVLLSSLWGFRRGHAWLWWALVSAGSIAYLATIGIHWQVGYTSLHHLLPAYGGLALVVVGGALSRPHLCGGEPVRTL